MNDMDNIDFNEKSNRAALDAAIDTAYDDILQIEDDQDAATAMGSLLAAINTLGTKNAAIAQRLSFCIQARRDTLAFIGITNPQEAMEQSKPENMLNRLMSETKRYLKQGVPLPQRSWCSET